MERLHEPTPVPNFVIEVMRVFKRCSQGSSVVVGLQVAGSGLLSALEKVDAILRHRSLLFDV
jgi:hypothetical protein